MEQYIAKAGPGRRPAVILGTSQWVLCHYGKDWLGGRFESGAEDCLIRGCECSFCLVECLMTPVNLL